jgi:uncharacterized heparinase superfamily protein
MRYAYLLLASFIVFLLFAPPTPAGDNAIDALAERIALLEKATLRDPTRPSDTHAARIEKLEKSLVEDDKAAEVSGKSFAALQREVETLSRRLADFEKQTPARRLDATATQLRDLEKQLATQERELRDLTTRIKKLESVVKP